jgi:hypothetical protein
VAKECIVPVENAMDAPLVRSIATLVLTNSSASRVAGLKQAPRTGQPANLLPPLFVTHLRLAVDFAIVISSFICQYYDS